MKNENFYGSAEHYNLLIWTIFSVGIALSLWILLRIWPDKANLGAMQFFMSILGFLVLFYCILAIESFGQKKTIMYKISNKGISKSNLEKIIEKLPYYRIEWIAEIILLFLFSAYVFLFFFICLKNSLATYAPFLIKPALIMPIISLILLFGVILNWIRRPKENNGNHLEKIRKFIIGHRVKSYEEIVEESLK